MEMIVTHKGESFSANLSKPIDLSIPIGNVSCFYATPYRSFPLQAGEFVGSIKDGAPVNFFNVHFNPHGHGTHTECLGHITMDQESVHHQLKEYHFIAPLLSIRLAQMEEDRIISKDLLEPFVRKGEFEAIIIRTLPNRISKSQQDYSGSNPPYVHHEAMQYLVDCGIRHLLIDLPSVDKEKDNGILASHHIFWNVSGDRPLDDTRSDCTITELIYVPNDIEDGKYLVNIQLAPFLLDAAPSRIVIYKLENEK